MKIIFAIISFFVVALLSTDIFFYPGFSQNNLFVSSTLVFYVYIALLLFLTLMRKKLFFDSFLKINKKYLFPFLLSISILLIFVELIQYPNFIFSKLGLHPFYFLFLPLFSAFINYISLKDINNHKFFNLIIPFSLIVFIAIKEISGDLFIFIFQEDSVAEYLQFVFYFLAGIYSLKIFSLFKKKKEDKIIRTLFLFLAIALFFVAFEEISWGQRLLGIETPDRIKEINYQNELTIHNLEIFQHNFLHIAYMLVGLYGAFSRIILKKFLPKMYKKLVMFTPPNYLFFCFLSVFAFYFLYDYYFVYYEIQLGDGHVNVWKWQEVFETYLSLGFLGYVYSLYKEKK